MGNARGGLLVAGAVALGLVLVMVLTLACWPGGTGTFSGSTPEFRAEAATVWQQGDPAVVFKTGRLATDQTVRAWSLQVRRADGRRLREFHGESLPAIGVAWDGLDRDGRQVPAGTECLAYLTISDSSRGYQVYGTHFTLGSPSQ